MLIVKKVMISEVSVCLSVIVVSPEFLDAASSILEDILTF